MRKTPELKTDNYFRFLSAVAKSKCCGSPASQNCPFPASDPSAVKRIRQTPSGQSAPTGDENEILTSECCGSTATLRSKSLVMRPRGETASAFTEIRRALSSGET